MAAKPRTSPSAEKVAKKATKKVAREKQIRFKSVAELKDYVQSEAAKDSSYRMVAKDKAEPAAPATEPEPESSDPNVGAWGPKPSVAHQMEKHPTTIRGKAQVWAQFVLSDATSLAAWNKLQERLHPPTAPQVRLTTYECEFSQALSSFVVLASYSEIEYQQI
jgi:hypothetical protein